MCEIFFLLDPLVAWCEVAISDIGLTESSHNDIKAANSDDDINKFAQQSLSMLMDNIVNIDRDEKVIKINNELDRIWQTNKQTW